MSEGRSPFNPEDHTERFVERVRVNKEVNVEISGTVLIEEVWRIRAMIGALHEKAAPLDQRLREEGIDPEDRQACAIWRAVRWLEDAADPTVWS